MWHNSHLMRHLRTVMQRSTSRSIRHHQVNHATTLKRAQYSGNKRANGPAQMLWKTSDGLTLVLWLSWQPDMGRHSCKQVGQLVHANRISEQSVSTTFSRTIFVPITIDTLGPIKIDGQRLFDSLRERLSSVSCDPSKIAFIINNKKAKIFLSTPPNGQVVYSKKRPNV